MKKLTIRYFTNELSSKEKQGYQHALLNDADLKADFEFQNEIFEQFEQVRLQNKIQLLRAQDKLRRHQKRQKMFKGVSLVIGISVIAIASWQYLGDTPTAPVVPASQPHLLPTLPARMPTFPLKPAPLENAKQPVKKQGLQPRTNKSSTPSPYADVTGKRLDKSSPSPTLDHNNLIVGTNKDRIDTSLVKRDAVIRVQQQVLKQRLAKKYKQLLPPSTDSLLKDYYDGRSVRFVGEDGNFLQDLSYLLKALYNLEKQLPESAKYCLEKIENTSDFFQEKQFCIELLNQFSSHAANPQLNPQILDFFAQDSSSLFYEKAKTIKY